MALADQLAQLSGGNGTVHPGAHPGGNPTNGGGGSSGDVFQQSNSQPRALFGKGLCELALFWGMGAVLGGGPIGNGITRGRQGDCCPLPSLSLRHCRIGPPIPR